MKLQTTKTFAFITSFFCVTTLASPLSTEISSRDVHTAPLITTADRFSVSGLDYKTWANKMVDEGKMYWPNKTSTSVIKTRAGSWSISDIACGYLTGDSNSYDTGESRFCNFVEQYVSAILAGSEYILQGELCEDGDTCTLILAITMRSAGSYVSDGIPSFCTALFAELYSNCNGAVGGSGTLDITDSEGSQSGTIEAQYYADDSGATCPANTDVEICSSGSL